MPSVTFDGQSFSVKGRRIWLSAFEFHYALIPQDRWGKRLRAIRHGGFNTVVLPCPWSLHESRAGRFAFDGQLAVRELISRCAEMGLWVVLKLGPVIGPPYEGGALPAWLSDVPEIRLRQPNPTFFERVTAWYSAMGGQCASLLATDVASAAIRSRRPGAETGPVIAVQIEDDWRCGQEELAAAYLSELVRFAREVGFDVPILTANNSFATVDAAIDALDVRGDALALMRQLAALRPGFPRFAGVDRAEPFALALAGRAQCVLRDLTAATVASEEIDPAIRRAAIFASSFGQVFAQANPVRTPIVGDPNGGDGEAPTCVVPVSGEGGTALLVTRGAVRKRGSLPLLLEDGRSLRVALGTASHSWFLFDADIGGRARLDFASASPLALVAGSVVAFVGAAGEEVAVSIDGTLLEMRVPAAGAGAKPATARIRETVVVLCNETQADATLVTDDAMFIGARSVDERGRVALAAGFRGAVRVGADGEAKAVAKDQLAPEPAVPAAPTLGAWAVQPATDCVDGTSHRYASLSGASSFAACGAREGYGWYRVSFRRASAGKMTLHAPELADRAIVWLDGTKLGAFGRGADPFPIEVKVPSGQHSIVMLVESAGRPSRGDYVGRRTGLFGPLVEVAAVKGTAKIESNVRVDPFALGFVYELHPGDARPGHALAWKLTPRTAPTFVLDFSDAARKLGATGTVTFNGAPVARWNAGGPEGTALPIRAAKIVLPKSSTKAARAAAAAAPPVTGPVELRFVLDGELSDAELATLLKGTTLYEVTGEPGGTPQYSFARWSPPPTWVGVSGAGAKAAKGIPAWSHATFSLPVDADLRSENSPGAWLEATGRGSGSALVNGTNLGRFDGTMRLFVPTASLKTGTNDVLIFDDQGASTGAVTLRWS